jgi:hypothetical protein
VEPADERNARLAHRSDQIKGLKDNVTRAFDGTEETKQLLWEEFRVPKKGNTLRGLVAEELFH